MSGKREEPVLTGLSDTSKDCSYLSLGIPEGEGRECAKKRKLKQIHKLCCKYKYLRNSMSSDQIANRLKQRLFITKDKEVGKQLRGAIYHTRETLKWSVNVSLGTLKC